MDELIVDGFPLSDYKWFYENGYREDEWVKQLVGNGYVLEEWDSMDVPTHVDFAMLNRLYLDDNEILCGELVVGDTTTLKAFTMMHAAWLHLPEQNSNG